MNLEKRILNGKNITPEDITHWKEYMVRLGYLEERPNEYIKLSYKFKNIPSKNKLLGFLSNFIPLIFILFALILKSFLFQLAPLIFKDLNVTELTLSLSQLVQIFQNVVFYFFFLHLAVFIFYLFADPIWHERIYNPFLWKQLRQISLKDNERVINISAYGKFPLVLGVYLIFFLPLVVFMATIISFSSGLLEFPLINFFYILAGPSVDIMLLAFIYLTVFRVFYIATRELQFSVNLEDNQVILKGKTYYKPYYKWNSKIPLENVRGLGLRLSFLITSRKVALIGNLYLLPNNTKILALQDYLILQGNLASLLATCKPFIDFTGWPVFLLHPDNLKVLDIDLSPYINDLILNEHLIPRVLFLKLQEELNITKQSPNQS